MTASSGVPPALAAPLARLRRDLEEVFGPRLRALVAHGPCIRRGSAAWTHGTPVNSVALVDGLGYKDLAACGQKAAGWLSARIAIPLLLSPREFERSLDAFPAEYGDILAHHVLVAGEDPFAGFAVRDEDLRRGCEAWGKSHLIQLREGFIEARGDAHKVARLILASASPFAGLLAHIARLRGQGEATPEGLARAAGGIAGLPIAPIRAVLALETNPTLDADSAASLYPPYLDAVEKLVALLDGWSRA
jgi:hypothetical protein